MIHRLALPSPSLITLIGHVLWRALHFLSAQHRRQLEGKGTVNLVEIAPTGG